MVLKSQYCEWCCDTVGVGVKEASCYSDSSSDTSNMTSTNESANSSDTFDEFAWLYPEGSEAEEALDLVYDHKELSQHHRSFIHVERRTRPEDLEDEHSSTDTRSAAPNPQYWAGYYSLALQDPVENKLSVG
ncbi:MAG: hypothetical protein Q9207_003503 [Kuettlingeria erythrocarpa]